MPRKVFGMALKEWIDTYYEDISVAELAKDCEISHEKAKSLLDELEKEGFLTSPVYNDKDRYKVNGKTA